MAGVSGKVELLIDLKQIKAADLSAPEDRLLLNKRFSFTEGTANGQADVMFHDTRTLAASATENLDLAGALSNAFGNTVTMAEAVLLYIEAAADNVNDVEVGPGASNGLLGPFKDASDRIKIAPGKAALFMAGAAGWAITAGTGDILFVGNGGSGSSVTYKIVVAGRTA